MAIAQLERLVSYGGAGLAIAHRHLGVGGDSRRGRASTSISSVPSRWQRRSPRWRRRRSERPCTTKPLPTGWSSPTHRAAPGRGSTTSGSGSHRSSSRPARIGRPPNPASSGTGASRRSSGWRTLRCSMCSVTITPRSSLAARSRPMVASSGTARHRAGVRVDATRSRPGRPEHPRSSRLAPARQRTRRDAHGRALGRRMDRPTHDGQGVAATKHHLESPLSPWIFSLPEGLPHAVVEVAAPGLSRRLRVGAGGTVHLRVPVRAVSGPITIRLRGHTALSSRGRAGRREARPTSLDSRSAVKLRGRNADRRTVNTIAATTNRIPRTGLIALVALVAAFALLMVVRLGVLGGSDSGAVSVTTPPKAAVTPTTHSATPSAPAKPAVVLLPDLPTQIASKLRYSKVVVVSVYRRALPPATAPRSPRHARGARAAGARLHGGERRERQERRRDGVVRRPRFVSDDARRPASRQDRHPDRRARSRRPSSRRRRTTPARAVR